MFEMKIPFIKPTHPKETLVISIEGCNGAGKTTLLNMYREANQNTECILCVPEIYQKSKDMKHFMLFESSILCSALYYLGGAVEAFHNHDNKYSKILFDRSIWSTFAAAYAKDPNTIPILMDCLSAIKSQVFLPDLIVVLDASFETCKQRISKKHAGGEFDKDKETAFNSKRYFYQILRDSGYPVVFLDVNNLTSKEVYNEFIFILSEFDTSYRL